MDSSISDIRKEYTKKSMQINELNKDPLIQLKSWFNEAVNSKVHEPNAMNLATVNAEKGVSSRIVLLKDIDADGIVFYTNYKSDKGLQIAQNPGVAVNFFWPELERQVRIEGEAYKVNGSRSDEYFGSRPRASQIGAWVSPQSNIIDSREYLEARQKELEKEFEGKLIPRPEHWGGYKITIKYIEFWQGRPSRLHDRVAYTHENDQWEMNRLAP